MDDWRQLANCQGLDPETFFPDKGVSHRDAKQICDGCVVRAECLNAALDRNEKWGIWGGMSERERRGVRRARKMLDTA